MIDPEWINLLIQIPIVAVFIWYSLEMHKRISEITNSYIASLDRHDQAVDRRVESLIESDRQIAKDLVSKLKQYDAYIVKREKKKDTEKNDT